MVNKSARKFVGEAYLIPEIFSQVVKISATLSILWTLILLIRECNERCNGHFMTFLIEAA